jgi:hypothetical protein
MTSKYAEIANLAANLSGLQRAEQDPGGETIKCEDILQALDEFRECVRYLNTRRTTGAVLRLESEADVQDALYLMLRPWIRDLTWEDPTSKSANRFTIKDLLSKQAKTIVEAKFVRDKEHGKNISKELHDDIETYRHSPHCDHLIFFIYDPDNHIPDGGALATAMESSRVYDGQELRVHLTIKP